MQSDRPSNVENLRQAAKACVVLSPLLGLTWAFGILSVTNAGLVFQYIFTILNSLQVTHELFLLDAFVNEAGTASIIINVRAPTNLPFARTSLPHRLHKWNPTVLPNCESCAWPNCLSFQRRVSLARNSSQFGSTYAFHLRTDTACRLWQIVSVLSFWCWRRTRCSALAVDCMNDLHSKDTARLTLGCAFQFGSVSKRYNKHLPNLFFSVRTVSYGNLFDPLQFRALVLCTQANNWSRKNAVRNSKYSARTRLKRCISKKKLTDLPITEKKI